MLIMHGQVLNIVQSTKKDFKTGELTPEYSAEILRKQGGKSVIDSLKLDVSVVGAWSKAIGLHVTCEVRSYAMKTADSVLSGYSLADKKSLPTVAASAPAPALKAA